MSLAKMLIKSPKKLKLFLNTIPIPIYAWQIRQDNLFLIDYNSAAYEETKGEIKNNLGSIASKFYRENTDLIDVLEECIDKSTTISKEIKCFCHISNEFKLLLVKTDFIPPDLVLVQKINKTKQNLLEQKTKESDENRRLISENANDILILTNEKYEIEYINNQALKKLLGYSEKEVVGRFGLNFINPDDVEKTIHSLKKGIKEGQGLVQVRARHKKGHYIWIEATGKTFNDDMGILKGIIILRDISKRKSFEIKLIKSEEKYRLITENIHDIVVILNKRFKIEYANENALFNVLGYLSKDKIGKSALKFIYADDQQKVFKDFIGYKEKGRGSTIARLIHKQGHDIWTETNSTKFLDQDGIEKALLVIRDISQRKILEQKLIESEEKYRSLFEKSPYMIILMNEKGVIIDFNKQTLKYLRGLSKNDLIGKNFLDLDFIPFKHKNKLKEIYKDLFSKGFSDPLEFFMEPSKEILIGTNLEWIEVQTARVKVGDDNLIQVIIKDISDRKRSEEKVRESEEMFRKFFEESQDGVILTDENGAIIRWNNGQERISGIKKADILGSPVWDAFYLSTPEEKKTDEMYNFLQSLIEEFFETGKAPWLNKLQEIDSKNVDGSYQCIQQLPFSIRTKKGFMLGSINRDITERKKIEEKLIESEEKYRVAYDQADFYKNLFAHDISNILFIISGSSQMCSHFLEDPEKTKEVKVNINRIRDQVIRAKALIKNVQRMSEINNTIPLLKSIDICESLTKSIKYINESYEAKSVEISVDSLNKQFFVRANDLILDVFENLLINSIKHNENSVKKITIRLAKEEKDGVQFLKMEFIDNGIGITDERKEIIFQKGHNKGEYSKGMGIGLTLVKIIIDNYNGFIWVEDRVPEDYSKGSNFIILIPLTSSEN